MSDAAFLTIAGALLAAVIVGRLQAYIGACTEREQARARKLRAEAAEIEPPSMRQPLRCR